MGNDPMYANHPDLPYLIVQRAVAESLAGMTTDALIKLHKATQEAERVRARTGVDGGTQSGTDQPPKKKAPEPLTAESWLKERAAMTRRGRGA